MKPSEFLTLVNFFELSRMFDNTYIDKSPNSIKCIRCGARLHIYNTCTTFWGVCPGCDLIGSPAEHLAQVQQINIDSAIDILADVMKIVIIEPVKAKLKAKIINHSLLRSVFNSLPKLSDFEGNPLLLNNQNIDTVYTDSFTDEYVRSTSEYVLRHAMGKLKMLPHANRLFSDRLILPLSDAPEHWIGFVTIGNEGTQADDYQFFFLAPPENNDVGFILPPKLHTLDKIYDRRLILMDNPLLSIYLQSKHIKMWQHPVNIAVYFNSRFTINYQSTSWVGLDRYKKIIWAPNRDLITVQKAAEHNCQVSPYGTKDASQLTTALSSIPIETIRNQITQTSCNWYSAAIKKISQCESREELKRLLADAKFNRKQIATLVHQTSGVVRRRIKSATRELFEPQTIQIGTQIFVEREHGWYRYKKAGADYQLASNLKCHIKHVIIFQALKEIYYVCRLRFEGHAANLFIKQEEFNKRGLEVVKDYIISKGWGIPDIDLTAVQFPKLVIRLSNPATIKYNHSLGWLSKAGEFQLPHFKIGHGRITKQRLFFPPGAPALAMRFEDITKKFNASLLQLYPRYIQNSSFLLAQIISDLIRQSRGYKADRKGFILCETLEEYRPLLHQLGVSSEDNGYNWPVCLPKLDPTYLHPLNSKNILMHSNTLTGFVRLLFGGWDALYIPPIRGYKKYPKILIKQLASVFYKTLEFYTDPQNRNKLEVKDKFELFNQVYQHICYRLNIPPAMTGKHFLNYSDIVPSDHFADVLYLLQQDGKLSITLTDTQVIIDVPSLIKAIQKIIGFCVLDDILDILNHTEAKAEYNIEENKLALSREWYNLRVQKMLPFYRELCLTDW